MYIVIHTFSNKTDLQFSKFDLCCKSTKKWVGEKPSLRAKQAFWCVQWHGFSIYMFQAVRRAVNVLNVSTCI